ncbi:hypothetical protein ALC62_02102, partial [Cyphomyrmex costatus]
SILCRITSQYDFLKELKICLRELSIVDDTLEALGSPKEYQMLSNWINRIMIGWIAITFTSLAITIYTFPIYYPSYSSLSFFGKFFSVVIVTYSQNVIDLSSLICGIVLGYTGSRFHRINDLLLVLYSDLSENADYSRRKNRSILVRQWITEDKDRKQYIWILT